MLALHWWVIYLCDIVHEKRNTMKRVFENPTTGEHVSAETKEEIKRYRACCWREIKKPVQYSVHGIKIENNPPKTGKVKIIGGDAVFINSKL